MATGTTLSRITGFLRLTALVAALGISRVSDAYVLGNNTPNMLYELIMGGILSATLLPVFVSLQNKTEDDLDSGAAAVFGLTFTILGVVTLLFVLAAPYIVHIYTITNHKSDVNELRNVASYLLRFFAPQILFYGFISVATALLNTKRRFGAPMFAPILNNVIVISMFLGFTSLFGHVTLQQLTVDRKPLIYLGLLTTAGVAAMALALVPSMKQAGISLRPRWNPKHPAVSHVLRLSGWTLGIVITNQLALWLVISLASLEKAGIAAYTSAFIFFTLPYGIFAVSIVSALQPELADKWSRNDMKGFRRHVSTGIRSILFVIVPASVAYILLAKPLIHLTLAHGAASNTASIELVAGCLQWMAIGLSGFCVFAFLISCFQAMHNTKTGFRLYVVENGINIIGALVVYKTFGVKGLAFVFGLAYTVAAILAFGVLSKRVGRFTGSHILRSFLATLGATAVMAGVVGVVLWATNTYDLPAIVTLIAAGLFGLPVYLLIGHLLGNNETRYLLRGPLARFAK